MVKLNKRTSTKDNPSYIIPSHNNEMREFIAKFKVDMMEHVVSSIQFAVQHKLAMVNVFQFKDSNFVVTISDKEFEPNLEGIVRYYMDNKIYELCPRIDSLRKIIKTNNDEKEKSKPDGNGPNKSRKKQ